MIEEVQTYPKKARKAQKRALVKRKPRTLVKKPLKKKCSTRGKITPSKLKKKLDAIFSLYIRAKYAKYCYTCNKPSDRLQCGHFIPRIYLATRWDENNCRPQCAGCNIWGRGQLLDFEENLIAELGTEKVQALKDKRHELWKLDRTFYEENIKRFTELYEKELRPPQET